MTDPDPFADDERLLRDHGDPADPLHDLPPDWGEPKPKPKARCVNDDHDEEFDDERFDGGDFDPPPAEDPGAYGFDSEPAGEGEQTTDWPPLTIEEWLARDLPEPDFIMGSWRPRAGCSSARPAWEKRTLPWRWRCA
jgi:hypothetical protein